MQLEANNLLQIERLNRLSGIEAFLTSLMVGFAEMYFAVYILDRGLGDIWAGLIIGIPMLVGSVLQFLITQKKQKLNFLSFILVSQSLILLLLTISSLLQYKMITIFVFILVSFYWCCSYLGQTYWNYWMSEHISPENRAHFFSVRGQSTQYGTMLGAMLTGFYLQSFQTKIYGLIIYVVPFAIAMLCRFGAWVVIKRQFSLLNQNLHEEIERTNFFTGVQVFIRSEQKNKALILFLFIFNFAIFITSPYITPYLISERGFSPASFMACLIALLLGKTIAFLSTRKLVQALNVYAVLIIGIFGMSPLPFFWHWISHTFLACMLQFFSGFFWGLFELSTAMLLFSEIEKKNKISIFTVHNLFSSIAIILGTLLGGKILASFGSNDYAYTHLFTFGSLLRLTLVLGFSWYLFKKSRCNSLSP